MADSPIKNYLEPAAMSISSEVHLVPDKGKVKIVDCGTGHPRLPTSRFVTWGNIAGSALNSNEANYGLPPGIPMLREAVADFCEKRYSQKTNGAKNHRLVRAKDVCVVENGTYAFSALLSVKEEQIKKRRVQKASFFEGKPVWILPTPGYDAHVDAIKAAGFDVEYVHARPENGFLPTPEEIHDVTRKLRDQGREIGGIFMTFPGNPSGAIITKDRLPGLAKALNQFHKENPNALIVLDDVYETLRKDKHNPLYPHLSAGTRSQTAVILSASKMFCSAGLCGAVVSKCKEVLDGLVSYIKRQSLSIHRDKQIAFAKGLNALNFEHDMLVRQNKDPQTEGVQSALLDVYRNRIDFVIETLRDIGKSLGMEVTAEVMHADALRERRKTVEPVPYEPEGALYVLTEMGVLFKGCKVPDVTLTDGRKLREVAGVAEDGAIENGKQLFNYLENLALTKEIGKGLRLRAGELHGREPEKCWERFTCTGNCQHLKEALTVLIQGLDFADVKIDKQGLLDSLKDRFKQRQAQDIERYAEYERRQDVLEAAMRVNYAQIEENIAANPRVVDKNFARRYSSDAGKEVTRRLLERAGIGEPSR